MAGGDLFPSHMVRISAGEPIVNGGLMKGGIDLMGDLTLIDYIIN